MRLSAVPRSTTMHPLTKKKLISYFLNEPPSSKCYCIKFFSCICHKRKVKVYASTTLTKSHLKVHRLTSPNTAVRERGEEKERVFSEKVTEVSSSHLLCSEGLVCFTCSQCFSGLQWCFCFQFLAGCLSIFLCPQSFLSRATIMALSKRSFSS